MGYQITVQAPWGAAEVVVSAPLAPGEAAPAAGNPDSVFGGRMRPGFLLRRQRRPPPGGAGGRREYDPVSPLAAEPG